MFEITSGQMSIMVVYIHTYSVLLFYMFTLLSNYSVIA